MLFSILIANYNNSRFLANAIDSVLGQSYTNWEIILADDGSTDEFEKVIEPYIKDSRIKIYRNDKNYGCGYTKRRCAEHATGTILAFLDPDDALDTEALKIMAEAHAGRPECSLIHSTHYVCDEQLNTKRIAEYVRPLTTNTPYLLVSDGRIHHFASFKKSCYDKTEGINPGNKKAVDQDLYYKLEETGDIYFINMPLYYYRIHAGAISTSGNEAAATLWHYTIIQEACLRRIHTLKLQTPVKKQWIKIYRTRYYKIKAFHGYRTRNWGRFVAGLFMFPFVGGFGNLVSYFKKIPKEGVSLIKRSFVYDHEIR